MAVLTITIPLPDDKNYTVSVYPSDSISSPLTKQQFLQLVESGLFEGISITRKLHEVWESLQINGYEIVKKKIT